MCRGLGKYWPMTKLIFYSGVKVLYKLEGGKVALPPSNKAEQEIFRVDKGCIWIQNGIKRIKNTEYKNKIKDSSEEC